jgi:hypothetical protein
MLNECVEEGNRKEEEKKKKTRRKTKGRVTIVG